MNTTNCLPSISLFVLALAFVLGGCQSADEGRRIESKGNSPADRAPHGAGNVPQGDPHAGLGDAHGGAGTGAVDPESLPLKDTGSGSMAELERARAATKNAEASDCFARGFHLIFTSDMEKRDYAAAKPLFLQAISLDPNFAEAYRGLAYSEFNLGFNRAAAFENYKKALTLKPDYGEVHYALAFLYAMDDLKQGGEHFKKAMELGIPDERSLRDRFYPKVKIETH
jgi:tetratricopeptide (TPR) repeat protein